jgi:hypothetical protein
MACLLASIGVAGCATQNAATTNVVPPAPVLSSTSQQPEVAVRYSAQTFFDTTSYTMAASTGLAFSSDNKSLIIGSDKSGVFNTYLLPLDGGEAAALTNSKDNAVFPATAFQTMLVCCSPQIRVATSLTTCLLGNSTAVFVT